MRAHRLAVLAVLVVALLALAAPAFAAGSGEEPPVVNPKPPVEEPKEPVLEPEVEGERTVLPVTGSDLTLFVLAGGLTVAVGAAMVGRARVRGAQL
jgi:hypothetical protein